MDISKSNFAASVNEIVSLIERSSFSAIDLEMTGITSPSLPETALSTPEQAYLAKRDAAKRYNIIQVGLCLFEEVEQQQQQSDADANADLDSSSPPSASSSRPSFLFPKKKNGTSSPSSSSSATPLRLVARPFNFFVFPSGAPGGSADLSAVFPPRDVTISADAASFLRSHGMDWSRWINTGVSYCNRIEMIAARDKMWKRREDERAAAPKVAREAKAALTDEQKVWLDAAVVQAASFAVDSADRPPGTEWVLPPIRNTASCAALRAAINADAYLSSLLSVSLRGRRNFHDCILVRRAMSPEEETSKLVLDAVGFSTVFQALLAQRRPIIGHNCFADWCFMMEAFFEPLPASLSTFKQMMRTAAPCVYDTKILAGGGALHGPDQGSVVPSGLFENGTHLEGLFRAFGGMRSAGATNNKSGAVNSSPDGNSNNGAGGSGVAAAAAGAAASTRSTNNGNSNSAAASLLEITLPLGFTNYDASAGKNAAAHEAGFDALMTGTIFGHFLTRFASTPLLDSAENKLALFRSLYAVDLTSAADRKNTMLQKEQCQAAAAPKGTAKQSTEATMSPAALQQDVFLPGVHEVLHIKHGLGSNAAPVENALRAAVENVSFFYTLGEGEMIACIGSGPSDEKGDLSAPATTASAPTSAGSAPQKLQQRPKAVTVAQLNERIAALDAATTSSTFTDSAALRTLKSMTRTHVLPPHLTWPTSSAGSAEDGTMAEEAEPLSKFGALTAVPAGAKGFVPPAPYFHVRQFAERDFRTLFRKVVARRS